MQEQRTMREERTLANGEAAAAILAAGIGALALGVITTLTAALEALGPALTLVRPAGPLSGKTTFAVVVWLIAWAVLHFTWRGRNVNFNSTFGATLVLIALGFLGTFPLFFEAFGG